MDTMIVTAIRQKDYDGLDQLIDKYGGDILMMIRRVLNHAAEKSYHQEVQNEVFYRIWDQIERFDPEKSSFKTWCLTIARHLSLDMKRKIIRDLKMVPSESLEENPTEESYFPKESFLTLVEALSEEDQLIFLKHYYYQDSPQEIAGDLGLKAEVIYNRLSRGRKKLAAMKGVEPNA